VLLPGSMRRTTMTSSTRSRDVRPGELQICGRCRELKGPVPDRNDGVQQLCECTPLEIRRAQPRWADTNLYAELCYCCGLVLLRSGSKFSPFFCEPCASSVNAVNQSAGQCLIPRGRHSFMNGISGDPDHFQTDEAIRELADQFTGMISQITALEAWAAEVVDANLATLGFDRGGDVALVEYLDRVTRSSLSADAAIESLLIGLRRVARRTHADE
jgi:hypothetical protein